MTIFERISLDNFLINLETRKEVREQNQKQMADSEKRIIATKKRNREMLCRMFITEILQ